MPVHLTSGNVFIIAGVYAAISKPTARGTLNTTLPGTRAKLTVTTPGKVRYIDAKDIDSGDGAAIQDVNGTVDNCLNWNYNHQTAGMVLHGKV